MITIKTPLLQNMIAKASKGAGNNKMLPLTGMMAITTSGGVLTLCTTDATNYFYVRQNIESQDDFYVVAPVEQLSKLISKFTSDEVSFELNDGKLSVTGNGTYFIELPLNEEGNLVVFPSPLNNLTLENPTKIISLNTVKSIILHNKPSLATTLDIPCYTCYYMDDSGVITTDTYTMCENDLVLFDEPSLLSREMLDILDMFSSNEISMYDLGDKLVFTSEDCVLYGTKMPNIGDYQIGALKGLLEQDFTHKVELSRSSLINALDRLSLFVGKYDNNKISMDFMSNELVLSNKANSGKEVIPYIDVNAVAEPFSCHIDVELLMSQLKAQETPKVELWYGRDNAVKLVDGDVIQIVALDNREE